MTTPIEPKRKKIWRLPQHRGVKLSSTLASQRELIREMRNKINELIDIINELKTENKEYFRTYDVAITPELFYTGKTIKDYE